MDNFLLKFDAFFERFMDAINVIAIILAVAGFITTVVLSWFSFGIALAVIIPTIVILGLVAVSNLIYNR